MKSLGLLSAFRKGYTHSCRAFGYFLDREIIKRSCNLYALPDEFRETIEDKNTCGTSILFKLVPHRLWNCALNINTKKLYPNYLSPIEIAAHYEHWHALPIITREVLRAGDHRLQLYTQSFLKELSHKTSLPNYWTLAQHRLHQEKQNSLSRDF